MRKVLLVPLLIFVPLAGLKALSINGATPGATVLEGGLSSWSEPDAGDCSVYHQRLYGAGRLDEASSESSTQQPNARFQSVTPDDGRDEAGNGGGGRQADPPGSCSAPCEQPLAMALLPRS